MKGKGTPWTADEEMRLRQVYPVTMRRKLAGMFGELFFMFTFIALTLIILWIKSGGGLL